MHRGTWTRLRAVFLPCLLVFFGVALTTAPAVEAGEDTPWHPEGIARGGIFNRNDSVKFTELGCNSVSFGSDPILGNYYIGRALSQRCRGNWSLVLARIDWAGHRFAYIHHVLDTRNGPVPISGGKRIRNAYDAQVMAWNNETWIAFECTGEGINRAATCMGPLSKDLTLATARSNVVIQGGDDREYHYTASVPKLLAYKIRAYI